MKATALIGAAGTGQSAAEVGEPARAGTAVRNRAARELIREARELLNRVDGRLGVAALPVASGLLDVDEALTELVEKLSLQLFSTGAAPLRPQETMRLLADVQELRLEIAGHRTRRAQSRERGVTTALRKLRGAATLDQVFKLVPVGLCDCGFSRAWISAVCGESWRLVGAHPTSADVSRRMARPGASGVHPVLRGSPEAEVLRRRRPLLVADAGKLRALDPLMRETFASRSYVIAPLLLDTRVVAFVHADRPDHDTALDEDDCDVVTLFAEAVSQTIQRVMLAERLDRIRVDVAAAARSVEQLVEDRCTEAFTLPSIGLGDETDAGETEPGTGPVPPRAMSGYAPSQGAARLSGLLTAREMEVLRLMASGETNASIARELVISEGTVKSHVKNVLRKLRVANRAQAVSRYFRVVRAEEAV